MLGRPSNQKGRPDLRASRRPAGVRDSGSDATTPGGRAFDGHGDARECTGPPHDDPDAGWCGLSLWEQPDASLEPRELLEPWLRNLRHEFIRKLRSLSSG